MMAIVAALGVVGAGVAIFGSGGETKSDESKSSTEKAPQVSAT